MARTSRKVEYPTTIETAQDMGTALRYWMQTHRAPNGRIWTQTSFAEHIGMQRAALWRILDGDVDFLACRVPTIEAILTGMEMSDEEAWDYFQVPLDNRDTWRTFRPPPMGHGAEPSDEQRQMQPEANIPLRRGLTLSGIVGGQGGKGLVLSFAPGQQGQIVVVDLGGGQLLTVEPNEEAQHLPGKFLGRYVGLRQVAS